MDNGESFFDISEGFFGNDNDPGTSDFSWADEFISSSENQEANQTTASVLQQGIDEVITASSSLPVIASQNNPITTSQPSFILANTTGPVPLANQNAGIQFVQQQQQQQTQPNQSQQIITSLPNLIGSTAQLVRGPNGQLILTSGPIQVQQSQQTLQPSSVQFSSQQFQTPSPSPIPASSPAVNRPITPASSALITKSVGSIQYATSSDSTTISSSKVHNQPLVGNAGVNFLQIQGNAQQQILARNIQVQGQTSSGGINVQGQQILQNQGHVTYLQGHGQSALLQGQQGTTAVLQGQTAVLQGHNSQTALLQGQQGHTAMLHGQGQNIVNTQNTVIQNPNVVNLNVAHVLCNNPALQNQQGGAVQQGQNIQGTLIQTADGKSIIIPSQLLQSGQPINLQNIQQVFQPQLNSSGANVVQGSSAGGAGLIHGSTMLGNNVTLGGIGNVIRMATNTSVAGQDKHLSAGLPVIGVNSQGQQVLIQRTQGQQQNIMVRTLTPQTLQQLQQPSNNTSNTSNYHASQASQVMQQPLLVSSQPGIQLQRIITPTGHQVIAGQQNQAVKVIGQNPAGVLSINLPQNISFQNPQMQTVQLLQQQVQRAAMGVKNEPGMSSQAQQVVLGGGSDSSVKTLSFVAKTVSQQGTHTPNSLGLQNDPTSSQPNVQNVFTSHVSVMPQYSVVNSIAPGATSQSQTALSQPIFSTTTQIPHVVPSVVTPQPSTDTKPPSFIQQTTLQARNNAPKLQTIQITPDTQKKLQLIQTELKTLQSLKQLTNEQMQRQKKLIDVQKSIIQKCAQQQQQAVLQATQPMIGQPQAGFPAALNMVEIKKEEPQMVHPPMIGEPPTGTVTQQVAVVSSLTSGVIQANATLSNASPLLSALSSATTNIRPTVATTQNLILNQVTSAPTTLKIGQEAPVMPSVPKALGTNLLPGTATLNSGTAQAPVPTQIKIANHVLQLNLTPDQKNKVEGYLARMTPEQQQQQIKLFLNLQRQQQLQAQVQAQKAHQAKLQQGKIPAPVQNLASGNAGTAAGVPTGHMILPTGGPDNKLVAVANMPKEQLIHQQLSKDQENALRSDTHTPFHNQRDMTRRLLRYHVFQSAEPPKKLVKKDKEMFENCSEGLMRKSGAMFEKFRVLLMKESMRKNSTAETVMIQRLLNEDLKETITKEKKLLADDPGSFKPIPLHILQKSEKAAAVKEEVKEKKPVVVKQEHPPEQVPPDSKSSSPFVSIKEEESNSRPTTPKFRLIIRNDGQKLTSSTCITEDGDADSDTNTYIAEESSTDSYGDNNSDKSSVGSRSMLDNIESKAADDITMDDNAATRWSDISNDEKPFSSYMETESAEASQMSYMNYSSNKMDIEETDSNIYPDQTETVPSMISSDDTVNYSSQNTFHRSPPAIGRSLSYTSDKALYRQDSSKNSNFSGSFSALEDSQKSLESSANSYTGSACAQYEPISSDEGDEEEGVSRFVPGKSEPYIISIGKHTMKYSGDSQSYLQSEIMDKSNRTSSADVIEIADNDSNLKHESSSSSDSDSDSEASSLKDDENVTNYQMQSAIDSILQYDNASSPSSAYHHMDQSDFLNNDYEASQSEESAINSPQSYDRQDTGDHTDTTSMEDDLDAAVKSILM